jgi:hypothetical protein
VRAFSSLKKKPTDGECGLEIHFSVPLSFCPIFFYFCFSPALTSPAAESDSPAGRAGRGLADLRVIGSSQGISLTCHARGLLV